METGNPNSPRNGAQDPSGAEALTHGEVEKLVAQLAEAEAKLVEMRDTVLRERAEIENQRKRLARDVEQARKFANERILSELLPACDNLERGLAVENADVIALREGMDLTLKALYKVIESNGLKPLNPLGELFNPEQHQAMSMVDGKGQPPNTVIAVFQKGYMLNDRLLRPAFVAVAKPPDA
jgi:molecular chaperone GrpE